MKLSERLSRAADEDPAATAPTRRGKVVAAPRRRANRSGAELGEDAPPVVERVARTVPRRAAEPAPDPAVPPPAPVPVPDRRSPTREGASARRPGRRSEDVPLDGLDGLRHRVRVAVVSELGPKLANGTVDEDVVRRLLEHHLDEVARSSRVTVGPAERQTFLDQTFADMIGWGALTPLMADKTVTEIMVNGLDSVWVERHGSIVRADVRFPSLSAYRVVIDRMLAVAGRRVDEAQPMADGRLPDGSRVNAIIPPLAVGDPVLTIRRFPEIGFSAADLIKMGALSEASAAFLDLAVKGKLNILVSGGTGTGKTTLLNVLSASIPEADRVITIEDAAELRLEQPHLVSLEARPANIEGAGLVTIRDLVRNALRMRPDRIVVGEVRGGEALDMLQAMNTGHEGSLTTVHANTPRDALARIETMVLMSGIDLPLRAIREQVSSAIDLIVQLQRQQDGSRVISHVSEVQGREGDTITLQDVFVRDGKGLHSTGLRPQVSEKILARGYELPASTFRRTSPSSAAAPETRGAATRTTRTTTRKSR